MLMLVPFLLQVAQPLRTLFREEQEYELRSSPESATLIGVTRYDDRLDDPSVAAVQADEAARRSFLARFEAIDTVGLSAADRLNRRLMIRYLREDLDERPSVNSSL